MNVYDMFRLHKWLETELHLQVQIETVQPDEQRDDYYLLEARVVKIFRGDEVLAFNQRVNFSLRAEAQKEDALSVGGSEPLLYDDLVKITCLEVYCNGGVTEGELYLHDYHILSAPTETPALSITRERLLKAASFEGQETEYLQQTLTGMYSNLLHIGRDFITGWTVTLSHSDNGYFVIVQRAVRTISDPVIVKAILHENTLEFTLPIHSVFNKRPIKFTGNVTRHGLSGKFSSDALTSLLKPKSGLRETAPPSNSKKY